MPSSDYVQYGCGHLVGKSWRNFDASPTLRYERLPVVGMLYTKNESRFPKEVEYGDILGGLPVANNSCKAVYCSHVLEHLSLNDCRKAIANTYRILQPGGTFRLVLPDLEAIIKKYTDDETPNAANKFMENTKLGYEDRARGLKQFITNWFGNSMHLWMWDYKSLSAELADAGFHDIRRAEFGDSGDEKFTEVEHPDRWFNALGIQCTKPE